MGVVPLNHEKYQGMVPIDGQLGQMAGVFDGPGGDGVGELGHAAIHIGHGLYLQIETLVVPLQQGIKAAVALRSPLGTHKIPAGQEGQLVLVELETDKPVNLDDSLSIIWTIAKVDDIDPVRYGLKIDAGLSILPAFENHLGTSYQLAHQVIVSALFRTEQVIATGTWTIFASDGEDTTWASNGPFSLGIDATTLRVLTGSQLPEDFALYPAHPNPFNPTTAFSFDLPKGAEVRLVIYDIMGREVSRLIHDDLHPGYHQIVSDGRDNSGLIVPTGIYIAGLVTPEFTKSIKMLVLK